MAFKPCHGHLNLHSYFPVLSINSLPFSNLLELKSYLWLQSKWSHFSVSTFRSFCAIVCRQRALCKSQHAIKIPSPHPNQTKLQCCKKNNKRQSERERKKERSEPAPETDLQPLFACSIVGQIERAEAEWERKVVWCGMATAGAVDPKGFRCHLPATF